VVWSVVAALSFHCVSAVLSLPPSPPPNRFVHGASVAGYVVGLWCVVAGGCVAALCCISCASALGRWCLYGAPSGASALLQPPSFVMTAVACHPRVIASFVVVVCGASLLRQGWAFVVLRCCVSGGFVVCLCRVGGGVCWASVLGPGCVVVLRRCCVAGVCVVLLRWVNTFVCGGVCCASALRRVAPRCCVHGGRLLRVSDLVPVACQGCHVVRGCCCSLHLLWRGLWRVCGASACGLWFVGAARPAPAHWAVAAAGEGRWGGDAVAPCRYARNDRTPRTNRGDPDG
jgi:hypothetical protein